MYIDIDGLLIIHIQNNIFNLVRIYFPKEKVFNSVKECLLRWEDSIAEDELDNTWIITAICRHISKEYIKHPIIYKVYTGKYYDEIRKIVHKDLF